MTRCRYCAGIKACKVCGQPISDFIHVGVRGAGTNSSGIWHYAVPCGHKQVVQVEAGAVQVVYNGGPLWNTRYRWLDVFWGDYWQKQNLPFNMDQIDKVVMDIETNASYSGGLKQYAATGGDMGISSLMGSKVVPTNPPQVVDDSQIQKQLETWIDGGVLPDLGMKGAYNIFLGPGVSVTLQGDSSCATFCDFHNFTGKHAYTVEPYPCSSGCNQCTANPFDTLTQGLSEEMTELKTDFVPGTGWLIGQLELCDFCDQQFQCRQIDTGEYVNAWYDRSKGSCWKPG